MGRELPPVLGSSGVAKGYKTPVEFLLHGHWLEAHRSQSSELLLEWQTDQRDDAFSRNMTRMDGGLRFEGEFSKLSSHPEISLAERADPNYLEDSRNARGRYACKLRVCRSGTD